MTKETPERHFRFRVVAVAKVPGTENYRIEYMTREEIAQQPAAIEPYHASGGYREGLAALQFYGLKSAHPFQNGSRHRREAA